MTALNKLTDGQLLFRLQDVYGAEQDAININDHEYAQECSDIVSVIREVMESRKALEAAEKRIAEHRKVLNSLAAVARRYLPDYDEHPEIQAADELLETAAGIGVKGE